MWTPIVHIKKENAHGCSVCAKTIVGYLFYFKRMIALFAGNNKYIDKHCFISTLVIADKMKMKYMS